MSRETKARDDALEARPTDVGRGESLLLSAIEDSARSMLGG
jgi:hypothetical protein